jgi:hypothetical protein
MQGHFVGRGGEGLTRPRNLNPIGVRLHISVVPSASWVFLPKKNFVSFTSLMIRSLELCVCTYKLASFLLIALIGPPVSIAGPLKWSWLPEADLFQRVRPRWMRSTLVSSFRLFRQLLANGCDESSLAKENPAAFREPSLAHLCQLRFQPPRKALGQRNYRTTFA